MLTKVNKKIGKDMDHALIDVVKDLLAVNGETSKADMGSQIKIAFAMLSMGEVNSFTPSMLKKLDKDRFLSDILKNKKKMQENVKSEINAVMPDLAQHIQQYLSQAGDAVPTEVRELLVELKDVGQEQVGIEILCDGLQHFAEKLEKIKQQKVEALDDKIFEISDKVTAELNDLRESLMQVRADLGIDDKAIREKDRIVKFALKKEGIHFWQLNDGIEFGRGIDSSYVTRIIKEETDSYVMVEHPQNKEEMLEIKVKGEEKRTPEAEGEAAQSSMKK